MIKTNKSKKLGNFIIILGFVLIFIAIFNFNIKLRITSMFLGLIFLILGILMSLHHTEKQKKSNPDLPPSKIYFLENNNKFIKILVFIAPIILFIIITRNLNLHILNFLMLLIIISFASWYFSRYIENNKQKTWNVTILLSTFFGWLGLDRLYLRNILGIVKLITLGGLGIWWVIDIILIIFNKIKDSRGYKLKKEGNRFIQFLLIVLSIIITILILYFLIKITLNLSKPGRAIWE